MKFNYIIFNCAIHTSELRVICYFFFTSPSVLLHPDVHWTTQRCRNPKWPTTLVRSFLDDPMVWRKGRLIHQVFLMRRSSSRGLSNSRSAQCRSDRWWHRWRICRLQRTAVEDWKWIFWLFDSVDGCDAIRSQWEPPNLSVSPQSPHAGRQSLPPMLNFYSIFFRIFVWWHRKLVQKIT